MTQTIYYDAIVIGAGQAGGPLSTELARAGWKTALIERVHVGGTCINEGCTPTKTMVASARVAYLAKRGADYGVQSENLRIDLQKVRERKRAIVDSFRNGSQARIEKTKGLELIFGTAEFIGPNNLRVKKQNGQEQLLQGGKIFINSGCRPAVPKMDGLSSVGYLSSTSIMELDSVPEHLLVLGGGYVGLEFGQMFRRFGSQVTIVQSGAQLLNREDPDVAEAVRAILREDGVQVFLKSRATRVLRSAMGIELAVPSDGETRKLVGTHLLVAAGRIPNTDWLKVSAAGLTMDKKGFLQVNER